MAAQNVPLSARVARFHKSRRKPPADVASSACDGDEFYLDRRRQITRTLVAQAIASAVI